MSVLCRAQDPTMGRITIDGVDIRSVSITSLRNRIAVVFQTPGLLYRSIAGNLRVGNPGATDGQLQGMAQIADAHEFIVGKPHGYDTMVAEGGVSLSGGERQRLALARALLKNAEILVLDEATSALDAVTEGRVYAKLQQHLGKRTTFIVAHRVSTIRHADLVVVLEGGSLVATGRYDELMARAGLFAELHER